MCMSNYRQFFFFDKDDVCQPQINWKKSVAGVGWDGIVNRLVRYRVPLIAGRPHFVWYLHDESRTFYRSTCFNDDST